MHVDSELPSLLLARVRHGTSRTIVNDDMCLKGLRQRKPGAKTGFQKAPLKRGAS